MSSAVDTEGMRVEVGQVVYDAEGLGNVFKSKELGLRLEEICVRKAVELEAVSEQFKKGSSKKLFRGTSKKLTHTYIGKVVPAENDGTKGRSAERLSIGKSINEKHRFIKW